MNSVIAVLLLASVAAMSDEHLVVDSSGEMHSVALRHEGLMRRQARGLMQGKMQPEVSLLIEHQIDGYSGPCQQFLLVSGEGIDMSTIIASMFIGPMAESWKSSQQNHIDYAHKQKLGYFAPICDSPFLYGNYVRERRVPPWSKYSIMQYLFDRGIPNIFWMDADSLFLDLKQDVRKFVNGHDLVLVGDQNAMVNDGHFLIRNTPWSNAFLSTTFQICPAPGPWNQQSSFMAFLAGAKVSEPKLWKHFHDLLLRPCVSEQDIQQSCQHLMTPDAQEHVQLVPQFAMNAYTSMISKTAPRPLLVHFAGSPQKTENIKEYAPLASLLEVHRQEEC